MNQDNTVTIPIQIPADIFISLYKTEEEVRQDFLEAIATRLFQEGKITYGKAVQLSGKSRYEFEQLLNEMNIPLSKLCFQEVMEDVEKMAKL